MNKILLLLLITTTVSLSQDMRKNGAFSLFSDHKALRIGDAVTILVVESSQASNNAETSHGRSSGIGISGGGNVAGNELPGADIGINTNNDFKGKGGTRTSGMVRTKISATVDSVLNNGNLLIKGSRKIIINGEEQLVLIKGIIRTSDIMADNSILSSSIAEAEIVFEGSGMINNAQQPGWLTRFFHWIF